MGRPWSLVLVLAVLVVSPAGTVVAAAPPDDARLTVTSISVGSSTPVPDTPVTLSVDLRNSVGSPSAAQVDRVAVLTASDGGNGLTLSTLYEGIEAGENVTAGDLATAEWAADGRTLAETTDLGTLSPGDTLGVELTTTFSTPGPKDLVVVAVGTDEDGNVTFVRRPKTVVVERAPPQLELTSGPAVEGQPSSVSVDVSNPTTEPLRNLVLTVESEGMAVDRSRTAIPSLAAGATRQVEIPVVPETAGEGSIRVTLEYTTAAGVVARTNLTRTVRVRPSDRDVGVRVSAVEDTREQSAVQGIQGILGGGSGGTLESESEGTPPEQVKVTVTNFGNVPARNVVVTPIAGDRRLPRQAVATTLPPGEVGTTTVDLSDVAGSTTVRFEVTARAAGESTTATTRYDYRPAAGAVRLTGIDMRFDDDGTLLISGNAGNVGSGPVDGVVVSVGPTKYVDPAYPSRTYFVGSVDASEFAPFELTADVDPANVSSIPVTVEYRVDGVVYNRTLEVPYDDQLDRPGDDGGGGPGIGLYLGAGLALLAVGVPAAWLLRRRD